MTGTLGASNQRFHELYERLVVQTVETFGTEVPVIVLTGPEITLMAHGEITCDVFQPALFHELKSICHIGFAVHLILTTYGCREHKAQSDAHQILGETLAALDEINDKPWPSDAKANSKRILTLCQLTLKNLLQEKRIDDAEIAAFSHSISPLLMRLAALAARVELDELDRIVTSWMQSNVLDRNQLSVVVCGSHQTRSRHRGMQYFQRLKCEFSGVAAELEENVIYGEGLTDVPSALNLLARHIVDQRASALFFGDHRRMQQDLLFDAASDYLDTLYPDTSSQFTIR